MQHWALFKTSSPAVAVDESVAEPSLFLFSVSQKLLGLWSVNLQDTESSTQKQAQQHTCGPAVLGFAFSFSQCLLTAMDPNRVNKRCVFQRGALSHRHLCLVLPFFPMTLHLQPVFSISSFLFNHSEVFWDKSLSTLLVWTAAFQHRAAPSALLQLRPGGHILSGLTQVTWQKDEVRAAAFFRAFLKSRHVFMSATVVIDRVEPHRVTCQGVVMVQEVFFGVRMTVWAGEISSCVKSGVFPTLPAPFCQPHSVTTFCEAPHWRQRCTALSHQKHSCTSHCQVWHNNQSYPPFQLFSLLPV